MIRLYGVAKGNASWARVTAGIRGALEKVGCLAGFYDLEKVDVYDDDAMEEGWDAPVGICIGPPTAASVMNGRGAHRQRLVMIATNSTWLPEGVMEIARRNVTGFIGTSAWASEIIAGYADGLPVYTWPHGVDEHFRPLNIVPDGEFFVLHLASTHLQRKSTHELIAGWATAMADKALPEKAELHLVVDGPRGYFLDAIHEASKGRLTIADSYNLGARLDLAVEDMRDFYSRFHFVCQPSRAEGFGLCPIEARACGIPVIATACTGHAEHLGPGQPGVVLVPYTEDSWIDDGPGARAPFVIPEDIAAAFIYAYEHRDVLRKEAREHAEVVRSDWSWEAVTRDFLRRYAEVLGVAP